MIAVPDLASLATFSAASVLLAITPGPDMTLFLGRTLIGGQKLGFAAMLGASTGLLFHALLAGFGLSAIIAASAPAFLVVKVIGAGYLLVLAYQAIRHGSALSAMRADGTPPSAWSTYLAGIGINLTNPKVIMFFVTFLPQFVEASDPAAGGKLLFLAFYFLLIGIPVSGLIILVAGQFIGLAKTNPKALRIFDYCFATLMGGFAIKLLAAQGR